MKPTFALFVMFTTINAQTPLPAGSDVKEYNKIFDKIAEKRIGADQIMIDKLENPFIVVATEENGSDTNVTTQVYILEATFDQKAKINGIWYKKNDLIGFYTLTKITRDTVILQNEIEKKELGIRTKDDSNIKIFTK